MRCRDIVKHLAGWGDLFGVTGGRTPAVTAAEDGGATVEGHSCQTANRCLFSLPIDLLLVVRGGRGLAAAVMALHSLLAIGLHLIPLLLLRAVEKCADLGV